MQQFAISEMQEMQKALQEKYKHKWEPICPQIGQNKLLWMIGEVGEVIDIVKKNGGEKVCTDPEIRSALIEEMADVLMYFNDVLLCYDISPDEFERVYRAKHARNMNRWKKPSDPAGNDQPAGRGRRGVCRRWRSAQGHLSRDG